MLDKLSSLIIVTAITAVIWLYAEGQKLGLLNEAVPVELSAPSNSDLIVRAEGTPLNVALEIRGPTGSLSALEEALPRPLRLTAGLHGIPSSLGQHTISIVDILRQHPIFSGVTIRNVEPDTLTYTVDRWVEAEFAVQPVRMPQIEFDGPVTVSPSRLPIKIAESLLAEIPPDQRRLIATPDDPAFLTRLDPGIEQTVDARIAPPDVTNPNLVRIERSDAQLTLRIRSQHVTIEKSAVPVHVAMPPLDLNRFQVVVRQPVIPTLKLSGPQDVLQSVSDGKLIGYLHFSSDELVRGISEKVVSFDHLPDDVVVESGPIVAQFEITPLPDDDEE